MRDSQVRVNKSEAFSFIMNQFTCFLIQTIVRMLTKDEQLLSNCDNSPIYSRFYDDGS